MKRYTIAILAGVAAVAALMQWSSCGGGGSATPDPAVPTIPTIISVTGISSGTTTSAAIAATGTTPGISVLTTNPLTITFSTAMDTATITTSTIGLSCGGTAQTITIANSDSSTNTTFTITPSAALTQYTSCTLTIGTGVQSSGGGALAAETTYVYTTGCTVNDAFTTDTVTGGCWSSLGEDSGTFSVTVTGGKLVETATSLDSAAVEQKTLTPTGNITAIVSLPTFSGITLGTTYSSNCEVGLMTSDFATIINIMIEQDGFGAFKIGANNADSGMPAASTTLVTGSGSSDLPAGSTLSFKIAQQSSTTYNTYYSLDGTTYNLIGNISDISGGTSLGSAPYFILGAFNHASGTPTNCSFANFSLTGATVSGQD